MRLLVTLKGVCVRIHSDSIQSIAITTPFTMLLLRMNAGQLSFQKSIYLDCPTHTRATRGQSRQIILSAKSKLIFEERKRIDDAVRLTFVVFGVVPLQD